MQLTYATNGFYGMQMLHNWIGFAKNIIILSYLC